MLRKDLKEKAAKLEKVLDDALDDITGIERRPLPMSLLEEIHTLLKEIAESE
jgi:hypothetical protein